MLALLSAWVESQPVVRGYGVESAEVRLRGYGDGRVAVWLRPKGPMAELRATNQCLTEKLKAVRAGGSV